MRYQDICRLCRQYTSRLREISGYRTGVALGYIWRVFQDMLTLIAVALVLSGLIWLMLSILPERAP